MLELILTNNRAFAWHQAGEVWAKGYIFALDGRQYAGVDLPEYFAGIETEQDFVKKVREANGSFCVAVKTADGYMVAGPLAFYADVCGSARGGNSDWR